MANLLENLPFHKASNNSEFSIHFNNIEFGWIDMQINILDKQYEYTYSVITNPWIKLIPQYIRSFQKEQIKHNTGTCWQTANYVYFDLEPDTRYWYFNIDSNVLTIYIFDSPDFEIFEELCSVDFETKKVSRFLWDIDNFPKQVESWFLFAVRLDFTLFGQILVETFERVKLIYGEESYATELECYFPVEELQDLKDYLAKLQKEKELELLQGEKRDE